MKILPTEEKYSKSKYLFGQLIFDAKLQKSIAAATKNQQNKSEKIAEKKLKKSSSTPNLISSSSKPTSLQQGWFPAKCVKILSANEFSKLNDELQLTSSNNKVSNDFPKEGSPLPLKKKLEKDSSKKTLLLGLETDYSLKNFFISFNLRN